MNHRMVLIIFPLALIPIVTLATTEKLGCLIVGALIVLMMVAFWRGTK